MTWYVVFVALRVAITLFFVMTASYSILNYTPFAFYHFIRPRVFGWVNEFVAWHHAWYVLAYVMSVITLVPDLRRPPPGDRTARLGRRLAVAYVLVFGLVAEWLIVTPYLPRLWNERSSFYAALWSFLPVVWLAAIDHVASRPRARLAEDVHTMTDQRHVLAACLACAGYLWLAHFLQALARPNFVAARPAWIADGGLGLALSLLAAMILYAVLNAAIATARATHAPRTWEYALAVTVAASAIATVLLKIVFPTIAFGEREPLAVAAAAGVSLALAWSGLALRRLRTGETASLSGIDLLIAPIVPARTVGFSVVLVCLLPFAVSRLLGTIERADWNFLVQKIVVVLEWVLVFGFTLRIARRVTPAEWTASRAVAPPVAALALVGALAVASPYLPLWTSDPKMEAEVNFDRYSGADPSFKLLYDGLIQHPGKDTQFYRYLQVNTAVPTTLKLDPPEVMFSRTLQPAARRQPDIFLFVLDSLRRDYVAPFNPAVTFTPNLARFAGENFAFQNAFSRYGGTALAVPSIWAGGLLIHRTALPDFHRSDALEKLLDADGYRWYMSLDTHMGPLIEPHPDLVELDRGRNVMQYDFCRTLGELQDRLDARTDSRPAFAFTLPQNLHISNRQHGLVPPGEHYPGFFEPYAAEVHRLDGCFGNFISYLRQRGLYDDSIIVLTTDHGDSLGESGNWGHGVTVYPEVVRIPLLIHVPERLKPGLSTDLGRLTLSTDIVPTLYELLGHPTQNLGPLFGSPLFVGPERELTPRRRQPVLVASSYAATYGLLRRNGRSMYIADLVNGREYAYDLSGQPTGSRVQVTDDIRRVNQRDMRAQLAALAALYHYQPGP